MVKKREAYAGAGLGTYWIVDRQDQALRCHELDGGFLVETVTHRLPSERRAPLTVPVAYAGRAVDVDMVQLFI